MAVLEQLQARMQGENQMRPWLEKHGLGEDTERIWQYIRIEPGWETAVEAVLRERVHALEAKSVQQVAAMLQEAPPGKVGLFLTSMLRTMPRKFLRNARMLTVLLTALSTSS